MHAVFFYNYSAYTNSNSLQQEQIVTIRWFLVALLACLLFDHPLPPVIVFCSSLVLRTNSLFRRPSTIQKFYDYSIFQILERHVGGD